MYEQCADTERRTENNRYFIAVKFVIFNLIRIYFKWLPVMRKLIYQIKRTTSMWWFCGSDGHAEIRFNVLALSFHFTNWPVLIFSPSCWYNFKWLGNRRYKMTNPSGSDTWMLTMLHKEIVPILPHNERACLHLNKYTSPGAFIDRFYDAQTHPFECTTLIWSILILINGTFTILHLAQEITSYSMINPFIFEFFRWNFDVTPFIHSFAANDPVFFP